MDINGSENTGKSTLERKAREIALDILTNGMKIYDFSVGYTKNELKIRVLLDKTSDPRGSVTIEECETYSRLFRMKLDAEISESDQKSYSLEVSSAGAEREISFPDDLERFKELPMKVSFLNEGTVRNAVLNYIRHERDVVFWKMAAVKFNKNQGIYKKTENAEIVINIADIQKINLHLDF